MAIKTAMKLLPPPLFQEAIQHQSDLTELIWLMRDTWPPGFIDLLNAGAFHFSFLPPPEAYNAITNTARRFPTLPDSNS